MVKVVKGRTPKERRYGNKKPKQWDSDRVCGKADCDTVISIYNKAKLCWLHQPRKSVRIRGRGTTTEDPMPKAAVHCYSCALRIGAWGQPVEEVEIESIFHWEVKVSGSSSLLCEIR